MTPAAWQKLALSQPGAAQKSHFEQPDFRVGGKIFAGLSRNRSQGNLKLSPETQAAARARSAAFSLASGAWGRSGWTHVELSQVTLAEARPLMEESWRLVAPKPLVAERDKTKTARPKPRR